jgi:hypothetical protein
MNNFQRNIQNDDGTSDTIVITSNDNYALNMNRTYTLANHKVKKESLLVKKFKGSILGADIGVKSSGFSNIAILATIIAVGALCVMYFLWRF